MSNVISLDDYRKAKTGETVLAKPEPSPKPRKPGPGWSAMATEDDLLIALLYETPHKSGGFIDGIVDWACKNQNWSHKQQQCAYDIGVQRGLLKLVGGKLQWTKDGFARRAALLKANETPPASA